MKKLTLLIFILSISQCIKAQIEVGLGIAVFKDFEDKIVGLELKSNFYLGKKLSISPSIISYFTEGDESNAFFANVDVHYDFNITDKFSVYPVIGIGVLGAQYLVAPVINSGGGVSYFVSNKFKLFTEVKTINLRGGPEFTLGLLYTVKKSKRTDYPRGKPLHRRAGIGVFRLTRNWEKAVPIRPWRKR
jgi:hypothetical protein